MNFKNIMMCTDKSFIINNAIFHEKNCRGDSFMKPQASCTV